MSAKLYRHTANGLALYLGAECEYKEYFRGPVGGGEWKAMTGPLGLKLAYNIVQCIGYQNPVLVLRHPDSMTAKEKAAYVREFYSDEKGIDPFTEMDEAYTTLFNFDKGRAGVRYWLRSIGIDIGGPCESSTDQGKTWREDWAESFVSVGLAKLRT